MLLQTLILTQALILTQTLILPLTQMLIPSVTLMLLRILTPAQTLSPSRKESILTVMAKMASHQITVQISMPGRR